MDRLYPGGILVDMHMVQGRCHTQQLMSGVCGPKEKKGKAKKRKRKERKRKARQGKARQGG